MSSLLMERSHFEMGIAPVADFNNGAVSTDIVTMRNHRSVRFIVVTGAEATCTSTFTVEACSTVTATATATVPYRYRKTVAAATPGAITGIAATGYTLVAGATQIIEIEISAEDLDASGYEFVRLTLAEVVNSPITGCILIQMGEARYPGAVPATATA